MFQIILTITVAIVFGACTQVVTAPIAVAGKVVTTTIDIAGATGGAIVNTVRGGSSND